MMLLSKLHIFDRGGKLILFLTGEVQFGTGEATSAYLLNMEATGAHLNEAIGQVVNMNNLKYLSLLFSFPDHFFPEK